MSEGTRGWKWTCPLCSERESLFEQIYGSMHHSIRSKIGGLLMKKRRKLKKGLAILIAIVMVVGMMPGVGIMKVSASTESSETTNTVTFTATAGTAGASDSEGYKSLIDGKYSSTDKNDYSKWCVTNFSSAYIIFKASSPVDIKGYSIVTGNDNKSVNGRNPKAWTLYGCNDSEAGRDSTSWETIDAVAGDTKLEDKNYTKYDYDFDYSTSTKYQYFKLEITAPVVTAGKIQEQILLLPVPRTAMTFTNVQNVSGRRRLRMKRKSLQRDIHGETT